MRITAACIVLGMISIRLGVCAPAAIPSGPGGIVWQDRVIPLPREMLIADAVHVPAGEIRFEVVSAEPEALPLTTARELLGAFAHGDETAAGLIISLLDRGAAAGRAPEDLLERLAALPNADQAYIIVSEADETPRLTLVGNTPVGMLYAARTLNQLVMPPENTAPETALTVPHVFIVDWPDIEQRGEWSGGGVDLDWNARWKLNMYKITTSSRATPDGTLESFNIGGPHVDLDGYLRWAESLGTRIIPFVVHLEHISGGVWGGNWKGVSVPVDHPTEPMRRPPHGPGFCWSDAAIHSVLAEHVRRMAQAIEGHGRDIEIWLTEGGDVSCWCDACGGENGYLSETRGIFQAFETVRKDFPDLRIRIGLSQGSADVNDRIIAMLPPDVGLNYYHGHLTYRIDREPIIVPLMEEFARSGGFLDVIPILNHWGPAVPRTLPQYVQFRMQEFAGKQLRAVTNFRLPDRHYYPFNVAAQAEWCWNAQGRSPRDFSRAFAVIHGLKKPELFAEWALAAGEAAWELGPNSPFGLFNQGQISRPVNIADREQFNRSHAEALRAWDLAHELGMPEAMLDSEITLAGFRGIQLLETIHGGLSPDGNRETLSDALTEFDEWAVLVRANMVLWHDLATESKLRSRLDPFPGGAYRADYIQPEGLPGNIESAAFAMLQAGDALREMMLLSGIDVGATDSDPVEIGLWTPEDFEGGEAVIDIDLSDYAAGSDVDLGMIFLEGDPVRMGVVTLFDVHPETGERTPVRRDTHHAFRHRTLSAQARRDKLNFGLRLSEAAGHRRLLEIRLTHGGEGSEGLITLRPTWTRETFPAETLQRLRAKAGET